MNRRGWIFLVLLHALLLIIVYIFQGMIFPYIRVIGFVPLLLPIVCVGIAVNEGCHAGGIAGLFSGILCDASFIQPIGAFTVLLTLTGLFIGALFDSVVMRGFITYIFSCFIILILSAIIQIFPYVVFANIAPTTAMLSIAISQTFFSLIFAFPIWFFVRSLGIRMQNVATRERPL